MKRSELRRITPLRRGRPIKPRSAKRQAQQDERNAVRMAALKRANFRCQLDAYVPEVRCATYGGRGLEVDEIRGGSFRCTEWLDLDRVMVACPAHHDVKTANKREILRRLEGLPHGPLHL